MYGKFIVVYKNKVNKDIGRMWNWEIYFFKYYWIVFGVLVLGEIKFDNKKDFVKVLCIRLIMVYVKCYGWFFWVF